MWVRTQDDELVNLDQIEYVLVEEDDESMAFEVRGYAIGWEPEGESEFYTFAVGDTDAEAARAMDRLFAALQAGEATVDFRDPAASQWSSTSPGGDGSG